MIRRFVIQDTEPDDPRKWRIAQTDFTPQELLGVAINDMVRAYGFSVTHKKLAQMLAIMNDTPPKFGFDSKTIGPMKPEPK